MQLPDLKTLLINLEQGVLTVTLSRPESRNAMSLNMVEELTQVFNQLSQEPAVRVIILRGAGGHFCAGGDIKDMASARAVGADAYRDLNRAFGTMLEHAQQLPQVVIAVLEGAVLGGGFGLACISDIAIAADDAKFGLPETTLGILPAQIAPFVAKRIGLTQARRLALTAARFNGQEAARLGVVHFSEASADAVEQRLDECLQQIKRCAPQANAATKALLLNTELQPLGQLLDDAAQAFADAVVGAEGVEGTMAFVQKRTPGWAV
ncbi:enoyl-CoA hydratase/isomerase family protein [Pseudomonas sp. M30-35]|uniref:enoyl-CoA hydratase/isomerase family protein n=1 Tax=Pseudomonas sp. M30-35 TaxID=1981174 RepID=UPI000B3C360D|nr:enoyl-CoA hydratase-related protein [Pseudomonas sp. M30-35]ARU88801.1 enoyl-CoA hydratase [Pseudomonas sp. M30-35]